MPGITAGDRNFLSLVQLKLPVAVVAVVFNRGGARPRAVPGRAVAHRNGARRAPAVTIKMAEGRSISPRRSSVAGQTSSSTPVAQCDRAVVSSAPSFQMTRRIGVEP